MMIVTETFLVSEGAGICMAFERCKLLFVGLAVGRTPANSSCVSCDRCRAHSFVCDVSLYCHVSKLSTKASSCIHIFNRSDVVRCCHTSSC